MENVFICDCTYRCPELMTRGQFSNIAFRTQKEAEDYCEYHSDDAQFWSWRKIQMGAFKKPKGFKENKIVWFRKNSKKMKKKAA
jgi:hypothetical protein